MLDGLLGGVSDLLFGDNSGSFDQARRDIAKNKALYDAIKDPQYAQYVPELLKAESINPELMAEDGATKSLQLSALSKLAGLSESGLSDVDIAGYERAKEVANQQLKRGTQNALSNAQARGVGGGGLEFAMRQQASQDASQGARSAALQQASDSANSRARALQNYMGALNTQYDQNMNFQKQNNSLINQFNERNAVNRQNINNQNSQLRNQAFQYNEGLKDKNYNNQIGRADRIAGFNNQNSQIGLQQDADKKRRNGALLGIAGGIAGGIMGGPAGAGVGYNIGSSVGGM